MRHIKYVHIDGKNIDMDGNVWTDAEIRFIEAAEACVGHELASATRQYLVDECKRITLVDPLEPAENV